MIKEPTVLIQGKELPYYTSGNEEIICLNGKIYLDPSLDYDDLIEITPEYCKFFLQKYRRKQKDCWACPFLSHYDTRPKLNPAITQGFYGED